VANFSWTPNLPTGDRGSYDNMQKYLDQIGAKLNGMPTGNSYQTGATNYFNKVMDPKYQAYSNADMKQMFESQKEGLINEVFDPLERKTSSRLANMGLAGSGAGRGKWIEGVSTPEKQMLTNTYNQIRTQNRDITNQNRSQAFGMAPGLSAQYTSEMYQPIMAGMQLAGQYGNLGAARDASNRGMFDSWLNYAGFKQNKNMQDKQWQAEQDRAQQEMWGKIIGDVAGAFIPG
jgi:hypothetical protein